MKSTSEKPNSIDKYIAAFPEDVQIKLHQIRDAIKKAAPKAEEAMKYAMPTFVQEGNLIHFAGYKNHIGIYPAPVAIQEFAASFAKYKTSKGAIQIPINDEMPLKVIAQIVKFNIKQNKERLALKNKK